MATLKSLREAAGLTQQALADRIGRSQSEIARLERGERRLTVDLAITLAPLFGLDPAGLLASLTPTSPAPAHRPPPARSGRDTIPIRGAARGGGDQQMFLEDGPLGHTPRPANLAGVRDAYAVYMVGDSMEPRYEAGWLLHVNPFKPLKKGRDVVVCQRDHSVLVKGFQGWSADALFLRQLNPPLDLTIPRTDILSCHLVVGVDQEG